MASGNYPPNVSSSGGEDWKKRLKALGIVRKRRPNRTREEKDKEKDLRKVESGRFGEALAVSLLEENLLFVLDRNVRYPDGEIDIVALDGATTVFVEVKRRRDGALGTPAEAVTRTKRARVVRAARRWLAAHPARAGSVRFDVVAIRDDSPAVEWLRGAFDASR
jgi:putative endonuclease